MKYKMEARAIKLAAEYGITQVFEVEGPEGLNHGQVIDLWYEQFSDDYQLTATLKINGREVFSNKLSTPALSEEQEAARKRRNAKARSRRSIMDEVADCLGLTKVRGPVSGRIYYE
jgi:hypothetical protein